MLSKFITLLTMEFAVIKAEHGVYAKISFGVNSEKIVKLIEESFAMKIEKSEKA